MKENPRLFIGTMYSGENEFEECCQMINAQSYKNFEHFIYKGLNYKDAHDALYNDFMSKSDEFDIMIKVDADMVIRETSFFEWVVKKFRQEEELDMLTMALHDFYLNELIWGMHAYRNSVKWNTGNEIVYTDRMHVNDTIRKREVIYDIKADHCKNPTDMQAFHFGFHRALKAVQPGRIKARLDGNWDVLYKIYKNFAHNNDIRLAYCLAGAEEVYAGFFHESNISYNKFLESLFDIKFKNMDMNSLDKFISRKRLMRFGFLPSKISYRYIFYLFRVKSILKKS
jgi:hypothetical protein